PIPELGSLAEASTPPPLPPFLPARTRPKELEVDAVRHHRVVRSRSNVVECHAIRVRHHDVQAAAPAPPPLRARHQARLVPHVHAPPSAPPRPRAAPHQPPPAA